MSYDFDQASEIVAIFGGNGVTADGTFAASVNSDNAKGRSLTAIASLPAAKAWSAIAWSWSDSPDGSTWTAVDSSLIVTPLPSDQSATTSVAWSAYVGKQKYVKAGVTVTGGSSADIVYINGYLKAGPAFQEAISGIEG